MRFLIILAVIGFSFVGGVYVTGYFLPERHSVTRSITVNQPQDFVWKVITDNKAMVEWNPNTKAVKQLPFSDQGDEIWRFEDTSGHYIVVQHIVQIAPEKLVSRITATDYPFSGDWIFELSHDDAHHTTLTLTEEGIIPNPFFRVLSHFILGYDMGVKHFITALDTKFMQKNTPEE